MIDTKKLRRLAQAVQGSPRNIHERVNAIHNLHDALPSGVVLEILDRLEDSEQEKERLLGLAHDQNRELVRLREECRALRAKITEMEQQEPAGTLHDDGYFVWRKPAPYRSNYAGWKMALYALPGARGEEK